MTDWRGTTNLCKFQGAPRSADPLNYAALVTSTPFPPVAKLLSHIPT